MSKVIEVHHSVFTIQLNSAAPGGMTNYEVDSLVKEWLDKGFHDVEVFFLRTNYDERQQATHAVFAYVFKKYADEPVKAEEIAKAILDAPMTPNKKTKKADAASA